MACSTKGSILLYGIPSVADKTFVECVLGTSVSRCLFWGFGPTRSALAEVTAEPAASSIASALQGGLVPSGLDSKGRRHLLADENVPLLDLYLPPPAASAPSSNDPPQDYSYLRFMKFKNQQFHVIWVPLTVEAFYSCGGVVPQRHDNSKGPKRQRDNGGDDVSIPTAAASGAGKKRKRESGEEGCLRCGSTDHFTRNCTGSSAAVKPVEDTSAAVPAPAQSSRKKEGGEACKHCGSMDHFSRNCDQRHSGSSAAVKPTEPSHVVKPAEASTAAPAPAAPVRVHVPAPAVVAAPATPQVSTSRKGGSSDACKHCGSSDHFSRNCPSK